MNGCLFSKQRGSGIMIWFLIHRHYCVVTNELYKANESVIVACLINACRWFEYVASCGLGFVTVTANRI